MLSRSVASPEPVIRYSSGIFVKLTVKLPVPAFMLHGIGGGVGHGRLQNKQEISRLRAAVVVKNRHSELKIVERRQRPPQQSVQNHRQLRTRHCSVPAALTGTMAASSSMIRNREVQTFFKEHSSLYTPLGTLCKHAGLIFPEGTVKAASTAFRYNALAAAIEMGIRCFLHQGVKCLGGISCVHCLDLQFDKK